MGTKRAGGEGEEGNEVGETGDGVLWTIAEVEVSGCGGGEWDEIYRSRNTLGRERWSARTEGLEPE